MLRRTVSCTHVVRGGGDNAHQRPSDEVWPEHGRRALSPDFAKPGSTPSPFDTCLKVASAGRLGEYPWEPPEGKVQDL